MVSVSCWAVWCQLENALSQNGVLFVFLKKHISVPKPHTLKVFHLFRAKIEYKQFKSI